MVRSKSKSKLNEQLGVVWGKMGESCAQYLAKGRLVAVQGRIQSRNWEAEDGSRRYTTEVVATSVEFLEWKNEDDDIPGFTSIDEDVPFQGVKKWISLERN